jgi:hypothetical protein
VPPPGAREEGEGIEEVAGDRDENGEKNDGMMQEGCGIPLTGESAGYLSY